MAKGVKRYSYPKKNPRIGLPRTAPFKTGFAGHSVRASRTGAPVILSKTGAVHTTVLSQLGHGHKPKRGAF